MQKSKFKKEMNHIRKVDTSFPIIVIEDEFDKYGSILDGNHRFAKLLLTNSKKVKCKFISKKELDKIKRKY
jgi:ParB-like chromosome segregation protein Spo0J